MKTDLERKLNQVAAIICEETCGLTSECKSREAARSLYEKGHLNTVWQPIETAPHDGTPVDLWHPEKGRLVNAAWNPQPYTIHDPWGWSNAAWGRVTGATHWMPAPLPPTPHDLAKDAT